MSVACRLGPVSLAASLAASLVIGCTGHVRAEPLRAQPEAYVPPQSNRARVDVGLAALDGIVADAMARTGVPGIAVAVVYDGAPVYVRGFGVREVGRPEPVDADTVFMFASVSKPIASTIVAVEVGRRRLGWRDPIRRHLPRFALSDPYVTANATVADMLSHGSGLRRGQGDALEDLGFDQGTILDRLALPPLDPFRSSYNYDNFGFTLGGLAASAAAGTTWEELADVDLFRPLGMTRSSYRHADFLAHENRARLHVREGDGTIGATTWVAKYDRDPDPQAPAGGASGSVNDIARFLMLQLGAGTVDGRELVDPTALAVTHAPHRATGPPRTPLSRGDFYGLGWNVGYDARGRVTLGHSGAFYLGAATRIDLIPGEGLGIAVLTNGEPVGVAEAIAQGFLDVVEDGAPTVDWPGFAGRAFAAMRAAEAAPFAGYGEPPTTVRPAGSPADYVGRYAGAYLGTVEVRQEDDALTLRMGPESKRVVRPLTHRDADTFTFRPPGENGVARTGATFLRGPSGGVNGLTLEFYDRDSGMGTLTLSDTVQ